jgi:hypothetical protein
MNRSTVEQQLRDHFQTTADRLVLDARELDVGVVRVVQLPVERRARFRVVLAVAAALLLGVGIGVVASSRPASEIHPATLDTLPGETKEQASQRQYIQCLRDHGMIIEYITRDGGIRWTSPDAKTGRQAGIDCDRQQGQNP